MHSDATGQCETMRPLFGQFNWSTVRLFTKFQNIMKLYDGADFNLD